jgi:predicted ArsR family transcriptional regulator
VPVWWRISKGRHRVSKPIVTKAQRRVLEELYAMRGPFSYSPEAELARQLGMTEDEVRRHLRALAKLGRGERLAEN